MENKDQWGMDQRDIACPILAPLGVGAILGFMIGVAMMAVIQ